MKKFFKALLILLILALAAATGLYRYCLTVLDEIPLQTIRPDLKILEVKSGAKPMQIIKDSVNTPVNELWYRIWLHQNPELGRIKRGYYSLDGVYNLRDLFAKLTEGKQMSLSFTIVAGTRFDKVLNNLSKASLVEHTLDSQDAMDAYKKELKYDNLEGLFLADTYAYDPNTADTQILGYAHDSLVKYLDDEWERRDAGVFYKDKYEALIMASIIEKETSLLEEYPLISAVFNNRLNIGMKLQTDPTVIYGIRDRYNGNITKADLKDDNPYNTYVIKGLPPTPISIPSKETIHATLHPANVDYLFFVANGSGGHTFSTNLKDHNRAVKEFLRLLKENKVKSRKDKVKEQILNTTSEIENSIGNESRGLENLVESLFNLKAPEPHNESGSDRKDEASGG